MDIQRHGCTITLDWNEQQILAKLATALISKGTNEPYQLDSDEVRILGELVLIGVY